MIKRGTRVIWHKNRKTDVNARCFGVIRRPKVKATALISLERLSKLIEVPLEQLEEPAGGGNYD